MAKFKVGDVVQHANGRWPLEVVHVHVNGRYRLKYLETYKDHPQLHERAGDDKYVESYQEDSYILLGEKKMAKKTSYTVLEDSTVGNFIGFNSAGQVVLEFQQPSGGVLIRTFDKDKVEKIEPFVISVYSVTGGHRYNFVTKKGLFKEKDFLQLLGFSGAFYLVDQVGVKNARSDTPMLDLKKVRCFVLETMEE